MWEQESLSRRATDRLNRTMIEASRLRQEVDAAASFSSLLDLLPEAGTLSLSPGKFVSLYNALPKASRDSLISSQALLDLYHTSEWTRTSLRIEEDTAVAYLIDNGNQPLRSIRLPDRFARSAGEGGRIERGTLTETGDFTGRIYPADRFFALLFRMTEAERSRLFPDPGLLLGVPKPVDSVGLAPAVKKDAFALIGFQSASASGPQVVAFPIAQSAFENLTFLLAMQNSDTLFKEQPDEWEDLPREASKSGVAAEGAE